MRLDLHLAGNPGIKSRAKAQRLIESGLVRVSGVVITKSSYDVAASDEVTWSLPQEIAPALAAASVSFPILYEDAACLVIAKPAGVTVHPGSGTKPGEETVLSVIASMLQERGVTFSPSETLVHRLDKETTGCLLIAKTPEAHLALQQQFAARTVEKQYLTIVAGIPSPPQAIIDAPIGRHHDDRIRMSVHRATHRRQARTTYRTLDVAAECALLQCTLHTGRTHQIRVHLSTIGHPVLGDHTYVSPLSQKLSAHFGAMSIALHAWTLGFSSPAGNAVRVTCPLPESFRAVALAIGFRLPDEKGAA